PARPVQGRRRRAHPGRDRGRRHDRRAAGRAVAQRRRPAARGPGLGAAGARAVDLGQPAGQRGRPGPARRPLPGAVRGGGRGPRRVGGRGPDRPAGAAGAGRHRRRGDARRPGDGRPARPRGGRRGDRGGHAAAHRRRLRPAAGARRRRARPSRTRGERMDLAEIDLLEDTWARGVPHEAFALLRREAPVFWHPEPDGPGFWAVTRHADVVAVSRDPATFSSELGATFIDTQTDEALAQLRLTILNMDPPRHNRYRRLVSRGFTPRMIDRLVATIERRAARIVDEVVDRGECEFVEDVAAKLPLEMICEMIGLPEADWPRMFELSNTLVGFDDPDLRATPEEGEAAAAEIYAYCDAVAADRRANPRDDLMTALVQAEVDGERLTDLELNLFFVTLVVAGNETT